MDMSKLQVGQSPEALELVAQKQQEQQEQQAALERRLVKRLMLLVCICVATPVVTIMLLTYADSSGDIKASSTMDAEAQTRTTAASTVEPTVVRMGDAVVGSHDFQFLELADGQVIARFSPMLPRNDRLLTEAISMVVLNAFADVVTSDPRLEGRWIVVSSKEHTYRVLIVKEDTGEVHSMQVVQV